MDEKTASSKKTSLWVYLAFVLGAFVILLLIIFVLGGNKSPAGNTSGQSTDVNVFLTDSSLYPSLGPADAKTTVIEFSDFQCPFCALASGLPPWSTTAQSQYGDLIGAAQKVQEKAQNGELRFIYVSMSFLDDNSPTKESDWAAEAGLCANEQGKFWEMHDAIFTAHDSKENNGKYSKDNLKKLAANINGIDTTKFNDCLDKDKYASAIKQISTDASKVVQGTPAFFVNGKQVQPSWQKLSAAIGS
jgi:protein-disulfide isomerase